MQRIKQWINVDPANVGAVALPVTLFEPAQRFVFIVKDEIKQRAQVAEHLAVLTYLIELAQHSLRSIRVTSVRFGLRPERRHSRVVAQLLRLFIFGDRAGQVALCLKSNAKIVVGLERCRIDFKRLSQLCHRFIEAAGVKERLAQVRVNHDRQRI